MYRKILIFLLFPVCAFAQIDELIDSSGDVKTGSQVGGITEGATVPNKAFFDDKIFTRIVDLAQAHKNKFYNVQDYTDFSTAMTRASADTATLLITTRVSITSNTTVSGKLAMMNNPNGRFNISSGDTLTFADSVDFQAGNYQIFEGDGEVRGLKYVKVEWFGAKGDSSTDNYNAINSSIGGLPLARGGTVELGAGIYNISDKILVSKDSVKITGQSKSETTLNYTGSGTAIEYAGQDTIKHVKRVFLENLSIRKQGIKGGVGLYIHNIENAHFRDVSITGFDVNVTSDSTVWGLYFDSCDFGGAGDSTSGAASVQLQSHSAGFYGTNDFYFDHCVWEGNTGPSLKLTKVKSLFMTGNNKFDSQGTGSPPIIIETDCQGIQIVGATIAVPTYSLASILLQKTASGTNPPTQIIISDIKFNGTPDYMVRVKSGANMIMSDFVIGSDPDTAVVYLESTAGKRIVIPNVVTTQDTSKILIDKRSGASKEGIIFNINTFRQLWIDSSAEYSLNFDSSGTYIKRFAVDSTGLFEFTGEKITHYMSSDPDVFFNYTWDFADNIYQMSAEQQVKQIRIGRVNNTVHAGITAIALERNATGNITMFENSDNTPENRSLSISGWNVSDAAKASLDISLTSNGDGQIRSINNNAFKVADDTLKINEKIYIVAKSDSVMFFKPNDTYLGSFPSR